MNDDMKMGGVLTLNNTLDLLYTIKAWNVRHYFLLSSIGSKKMIINILKKVQKKNENEDF